MLKNEKNNKYYDDLLKKGWRNAANFGPSILSRYRVLTSKVVKYISPNQSLHECGSGSGELLLRLKRLGMKNISGSDFSIDSVKIAKKKTKLDIFQADVIKLSSFPKKKYYAIVCSEVLEHVLDDVKAIKNMYSLLEKDGYLFISVPYLMKHWSISDELSGHVRRYEPKEMENKLINAGFTIIEAYGWGNFVYSLYYSLLIRSNLKKVRSENKKIIKKIVAKILYYVFFLEDLFVSNKRGRRLFIVARKNS